MKPKFQYVLIDEIEDIVVNKALYPLLVLRKTQESGILTTEHLDRSADSLETLLDWVKNLRN